MNSNLPIPSTGPIPQRITLDWRAYFISFCDRHGEPVEWKGRLLFDDGWTYALTDYAGPEWGPPSDPGELDQTVTHYWIIKKGKLDRLLAKLIHDFDMLKKTISMHSLPLQQTVKVSEGVGTQQKTVPLNLDGLEARIEWVREDLYKCDERLQELERYYREKRSTA